MTQKRSQSTREKILAAALEIFQEEGSVLIPVARLSERSGISVGSIYHHFECMEGVAAALYGECLGSLLDAVADSLRGARNIDGAVKKMVAAYLSWTGAHPDRARYIHASFAAPFISRYRESIAAVKKSRIEEMSARVMALLPPTIREVSPALVEIMIIGPAAETARRWLDGVPGIDLKQAAKILPASILGGLGAS